MAEVVQPEVSRTGLQPNGEGVMTRHCDYCGTMTIEQFCDDLCRQAAAGVAMCFDCGAPEEHCSCEPRDGYAGTINPYPYGVTVVALIPKADLL